MRRIILEDLDYVVDEWEKCICIRWTPLTTKEARR